MSHRRLDQAQQWRWVYFVTVPRMVQMVRAQVQNYRVRVAVLRLERHYCQERYQDLHLVGRRRRDRYRVHSRQALGLAWDRQNRWPQDQTRVWYCCSQHRRPSEHQSGDQIPCQIHSPASGAERETRDRLLFRAGKGIQGRGRPLFRLQSEISSQLH